MQKNKVLFLPFNVGILTGSVCAEVHCVYRGGRTIPSGLWKWSTVLWKPRPWVSKQVHETNLPNFPALSCLRNKTGLFFRQLEKNKSIKLCWHVKILWNSSILEYACQNTAMDALWPSPRAASVLWRQRWETTTETMCHTEPIDSLVLNREVCQPLAGVEKAC